MGPLLGSSVDQYKKLSGKMCINLLTQCLAIQKSLKLLAIIIVTATICTVHMTTCIPYIILMSIVFTFPIRGPTTCM